MPQTSANNTQQRLKTFAQTIANWQKAAGRHHLPWQESNSPYTIWLSEIMLQQTQVATVIPYYQRFLARFPTLKSLATADVDEILPYWAGLGYYQRAHNLHKCAQIIYFEHAATFPKTAQELEQLPGIGRTTAAAIAAFAYGERAAIMDGNVQRVLARYLGIRESPHKQAGKRLFWDYAEQALKAAPNSLDMTAYTQGQMDLGATLCRRSSPNCQPCPLQASCYAFAHQVQDQLPTRRARKTPPKRHCFMLVAQNAQNEFLLEKQDDVGIWAGLWALPQFEQLDDLHQYCRQQGFSRTTKAKRLTRVNHAFSHFSLAIEPWYVTGAPLTVKENDARLQWFCAKNLQDAALPAPIRQILTPLINV